MPGKAVFRTSQHPVDEEPRMVGSDGSTESRSVHDNGGASCTGCLYSKYPTAASTPLQLKGMPSSRTKLPQNRSIALCVYFSGAKADKCTKANKNRTGPCTGLLIPWEDKGSLHHAPRCRTVCNLSKHSERAGETTPTCKSPQCMRTLFSR